MVDRCRQHAFYGGYGNLKQLGDKHPLTLYDSVSNSFTHFVQDGKVLLDGSGTPFPMAITYAYRGDDSRDASKQIQSLPVGAPFSLWAIMLVERKDKSGTDRVWQRLKTMNFMLQPPDYDPNAHEMVHTLQSVDGDEVVEAVAIGRDYSLWSVPNPIDGVSNYKGNEMTLVYRSVRVLSNEGSGVPSLSGNDCYSEEYWCAARKCTEAFCSDPRGLDDIAEPNRCKYASNVTVQCHKVKPNDPLSRAIVWDATGCDSRCGQCPGDYETACVKNNADRYCVGGDCKWCGDKCDNDSVCGEGYRCVDGHCEAVEVPGTQVPWAMIASVGVLVLFGGMLRSLYRIAYTDTTTV